MRTGAKGGGELLFAEHRPEWQTVADSLGDRDHIGIQVVMLVSELLARPPDPGLDFVDNQEGAGLVAGGLDLGQPVWLTVDDPTFALDDFQDHAGGLVVN